ncbi:hypothetical protein SORBI_3010G126200 [Sorghum bicolor]|uniref:Uncharacterized protein n=1 Tax=Sorghum bicolor TaxID=4558 RepID=A0A194YIQ3_SORBI|nr:hypothetical protein SORBI_3010G126200 [Sorghum bicolor]
MFSKMELLASGRPIQTLASGRLSKALNQPCLFPSLHSSHTLFPTFACPFPLHTAPPSTPPPPETPPPICHLSVMPVICLSYVVPVIYPSCGTVVAAAPSPINPSARQALPIAHALCVVPSITSQAN